MPRALFAATGADTGVLSNIGNGMEHKVGNGEWIAISAGGDIALTGLAIDDLQVRARGDGVAILDSGTQKIRIERADASARVGKVDYASPLGNDGRLIGVNEAMEYQKSGTSTWLPCTGREVTGLSDGEYRVRFRADGNVLASDAQTLVIGAGQAPTYALVVTPDEAISAEQAQGYEAPDWKKFTVTNRGTGNVKNLRVMLGGADADCFVLDKSGMADLLETEGDDASVTTFQVRPRVGLKEGSYTASVEVTADSLGIHTKKVTFHVRSKEEKPTGGTSESASQGGAQNGETAGQNPVADEIQSGGTSNQNPVADVISTDSGTGGAVGGGPVAGDMPGAMAGAGEQSGDEAVPEVTDTAKKTDSVKKLEDNSLVEPGNLADNGMPSDVQGPEFSAEQGATLGSQGKKESEIEGKDAEGNGVNTAVIAAVGLSVSLGGACGGGFFLKKWWYGKKLS